MRLILSEYIRTLKERNELDRLLPELLLSMGIFPTAKTQTGTRQFGVDLSAIGKDPADGVKKLFLFVIKQGDLGRTDWENGIQAIRPSLNEIFDVYINSLIPEAQKHLPKVVVLTTSGEMKEELKINWAGYTMNEKRASFDLWDAPKLALLIEEYLLNENVFPSQDRKDLRRALALAGEIDYRPDSLYALLERQLNLSHFKEHSSKARHQDTRNQLILATLSANIFASWALEENNTKQSLIVAERLLLWVWHRIKDKPVENNKTQKQLETIFESVWMTYYKCALAYFEKIKPYCEKEDGLTDHLMDNIFVSLILFESIGLLASFGLVCLSTFGSVKLEEVKNTSLTEKLAETLLALIRNNTSTGSPLLDDQVTDVNLGLLFLAKMGRDKEAGDWLEQLVVRTVFSFRQKRRFPANTLDELINDEYEYATLGESGFNYMSWMLPSLADWCVYFGKSALYETLVDERECALKRICLQLWHPTEELESYIFLKNAIHESGLTEAPIELMNSISEYKLRIKAIIEAKSLDVRKGTLSHINLVFLACRHFRTLVPPFLIYSEFQQLRKNSLL